MLAFAGNSASSGGVTVALEAYFDESGTHDASPVMSVAGYLFSRDQALKLDEAWRICLKEYDIPYFRMSECAHGTGVFKPIPLNDRIAIQRRMIGAIKLRAERGF